MLRDAYRNCRGDAKRRGIAFKLTYEQWLDIWIKSGRLADRGRGLGKYQMARHEDRGPYAIGNVSIITQSQNVADCNRNYRRGAKLSMADVKCIRTSKLSTRKLAKRYGVAASTIHYVVTLQSYA